MNGRTLGALKDPRYTGQNRCPPCTVVNVGIAMVVAALVGWLSTLLGAVCFVIFVLVIYFKGYLVPGTPALTRRYLPSSLLSLFGKASRPGGTTAGMVASDLGTDGGSGGGTQSTPSGGSTDHYTDPQAAYDVDPESLFLDVGIVEPCGGELCLTDEFAAAWRDRMENLANDEYRDRLAALLDRDPSDLSIDDEGDAVVVVDRGTPTVAWPSETALGAVLAAVPELRERHPNWHAVPLEVKDRLLNGLLVFMEHCPECDGSVSMEGTEVTSCCNTMPMVTVACDDCGTTFLRMGV